MHGPYLDDNGRTPAHSRHVLYGALTGGPGQDGSFTDDRLDAVKNEVATDYNAGFSSALARLVFSEGGAPLDGFPPISARDTEYVVVAKINTQGDRFTEVSATVQNRTTWPARYSENLKIRYYVDLSEVIAAGLMVTDVIAEYRACQLCSGPLTVSKLEKAAVGTEIYFTEIDFGNERIFPGGQSAFRREVQFRVGLPETAPQTVWDPSNDPSYAGLTASADTGGHRLIPAYENGTLVWGKEIDGTEFTPGKWNRPDFTEPPYAPSGWDTTLFKGKGPIGVRSGFPGPGLPGPYAMWLEKGTMRIEAYDDIRIDAFTLDGESIVKMRLMNGETRVRSFSGFPPGIIVFRILRDGRAAGAVRILHQ